MNHHFENHSPFPMSDEAVERRKRHLYPIVGTIAGMLASGYLIVGATGEPAEPTCVEASIGEHGDYALSAVRGAVREIQESVSTYNPSGSDILAAASNLGTVYEGELVTVCSSDHKIDLFDNVDVKRPQS